MVGTIGGTTTGPLDAEETVERYRSRTGYTPTNLHYYEVLAATKLSWLMVRAAHLMIAAGLLRP